MSVKEHRSKWTVKRGTNVLDLPTDQLINLVRRKEYANHHKMAGFSLPASSVQEYWLPPNVNLRLFQGRLVVEDLRDKLVISMEAVGEDMDDFLRAFTISLIKAWHYYDHQ